MMPEEVKGSAVQDMTSVLSSITADKNWLMKVSIGSTVSYIALAIFLLNPMFAPVSVVMGGITAGYLLRVMRQTINVVGTKDETDGPLPEWNQILDLMISGVSWLSFSLFFSFGGVILAFSLFTHGLQSRHSLVIDPHFTTWGTSTFLAIYSYYVLTSFFTALLMANFAEEEKMMAGFAWLKVIKRIAKAPVLMLTTWLASATMVFLAATVPSLTVIGVIFAPFLTFLAQVIQARMLGFAWRAAR
ncbi:MAG: DUF4013 domain-containing protein [Candidatus Melainabacteria bacterium]|nr:DUF4013 domain-containing protein [Candidatus Melainabacteria bacterium]